MAELTDRIVPAGNPKQGDKPSQMQEDQDKAARQHVVDRGSNEAPGDPDAAKVAEKGGVVDPDELADTSGDPQGLEQDQGWQALTQQAVLKVAAAVYMGDPAAPMPSLLDAYGIGLSHRQVRELTALICCNRHVPAWWWWHVMDLAADGDRELGALLDPPNPRRAC